MNLLDSMGLDHMVAKENDPPAMGSTKAWQGFQPGDPV